jgi:hypothetical protein
MHRFAEQLPRITASGASAHSCPECATVVEPWEGQPAPRLYGFTARDVAIALARVAHGASYREAASQARTSAGRELESTAPATVKGKQRRAPANRHAQLVSDWVQTFAPALWDHYAPTSWPAVLLLDEDELRYVSGAPRGTRAFYVLGAVGYDASNRPYVAGLEAVPRVSVPVWTKFLASKPGVPTWVVTDRGHAGKAVHQSWAATATPPQLRYCEWHLARSLDNALPSGLARDDELRKALLPAMAGAKQWLQLNHMLRRGGYLNAMNYYQRIDQLVRQQIATRNPAMPNSTGALEEFFHQLDQTIGDRAARMTNKPRADALLKLLGAARNGWVDEAEWAEVIRAELTRHRGYAPQQRQNTDPKLRPSLR